MSNPKPTVEQIHAMLVEAPAGTVLIRSDAAEAVRFQPFMKTEDHTWVGLQYPMSPGIASPIGIARHLSSIAHWSLS